MNKIHWFTLIELLIVVVIISILAVALIPRLRGIQSQARDKQRIADLRQLQTALEFYANEHMNKYPTTWWWWRWICSWYNPWWIYSNSGQTSWIPNLAPDYISELPNDPKPKWISGCYLYKSNWNDYLLLAFLTVEWKIPSELERLNPIPSYNVDTFAIYSSGWKNF